jgi:chemotaxis protein methyltransferase CheR
MTSAAATREFEFTLADFGRVRELIRGRAGIALASSKQEMVYSRLSRRLRERGMNSFSRYLAELDDPASAEWEPFTNALTTNLTSFFREAHHFPILAEHARRVWRDRPLRVWCCAASTGEEPYSIAITLMEAAGAGTPAAHIVATDLDTEVLATARAGVYDASRVEHLEESRLRQFFLRGTGAAAGKVRVKPEVAALVRFGPLNLLAPQWPDLRPFDVIFCRNVMIYFDKATQLQVLRRFVPLLHPDGLLFAGHSETFFQAADIFRLRGHTVYQPVPGAAGRAA